MVSRGFYKHYRGVVYFVLGVGVLHDENRRIVIYESPQSALDGMPRLRFEDEWEEFVDPLTGEKANESTVVFVRRFERLDETTPVDVRVKK